MNLGADLNDLVLGGAPGGTVSTPFPPQVEAPQESYPADPSAGQPAISSTPVTPPLLPPALITTPTPVLPSVEQFPAIDGQGPQISYISGDPGLTRPTGPIGGVPSGLRSTTESGAGPSRKAQVDSENQVADAFAAAGYRTVQNPTKGPNPPLTPERMAAEGLNPSKDPDLLIEDRVFDTYTPEADDANSIRNGIANKVRARQTDRVAVDLRGTTQTEASVRAALRANPVSGLKEVVVRTEDGLGQPFRP